MEYYSIPSYHNTFDSIVSYIYLLVIVIPDIRMSYDTFDTTVISSTKTEAHNLDTINASAAANIHADTAEISQFLKSVV